MRRIEAAAVAVILTCFSVCVQAMPVQWTLDDVNFDDFGTAIGSFVYDADTDVMSDASVVTTPGSSFDGAVYTEIRGGGTSPIDNIFLFLRSGTGDLRGQSILQLMFAPGSLTNAGGTIPIFLDANPIVGEISCLNSTCDMVGEVRDITSGSVTASTIPIPATAWLFGSALGLLGWMQRKVL